MRFPKVWRVLADSSAQYDQGDDGGGDMGGDMGGDDF